VEFFWSWGCFVLAADDRVLCLWLLLCSSWCSGWLFLFLCFVVFLLGSFSAFFSFFLLSFYFLFTFFFLPFFLKPYLAVFRCFKILSLFSGFTAFFKFINGKIPHVKKVFGFYVELWSALVLFVHVRIWLCILILISFVIF